VSSSTTIANYISKNYKFCILKNGSIKKKHQSSRRERKKHKERTNAQSQNNTQKRKEGKGAH
jgi:hypothetical protein